MFDGDGETRWLTGRAQTGDEWIRLEFDRPRDITHLELQTADPGATLDLIENAGAIFLGADAPVSLGDYLAGSNPVLPTGGQ